MGLKREPELKGSMALSVIGEGVTIEGKIMFPGSSRIDGIINGKILCAKDLVIGKEGKVSADVQTGSAVIAGAFKGKMEVPGSVEITSTGKFVGKLIQKEAILTIVKGGVFKGESFISSGNSELNPTDIPKRD